MSFIDSIKSLFDHIPQNARVFEVTGMHCGHCEAHIKEMIEKLDGVQSVNASHKKKRVVVMADEKVTNEMIKDVIKEAGFEVN